MLSSFFLIFVFVENSSIDEFNFFHENNRFFDVNKIDVNFFHSKNF